MVTPKSLAENIVALAEKDDDAEYGDALWLDAYVVSIAFLQVYQENEDLRPIAARVGEAEARVAELEEELKVANVHLDNLTDGVNFVACTPLGGK